MKTLGTFASIAACLIMGLVGCAPVEEETTTPVAATEEALSSPPVSAAQCRAFKNRFPVTETVRLSTGDVVSTPLRACDMNVAAIFGTIDLAFAKSLYAGTGHVPLEVVRAGKPNAALARLYFVDYLSADLGPYRELIVLVDGAEETATKDAKTLSYANQLSTLLPVFDPQNRTAFHQLILSKESPKAIAYGRELLGADKRGGTVDFGYPSDDITVSVKDEKGAGVLKTTLRPDMSLFTLVGTVGNVLGAAIAERIGLHELSLKLNLMNLNQPIGLAGITIGKNPETGEQVRTRTDFVYLPSMNAANSRTLDFELDRSSDLGRQLSDAHFTPTAFITAKHVSGAWTILD